MAGAVFFRAAILAFLHEFFFFCEVKSRVVGKGIESRLRDRRHFSGLNGVAESVRERVELLMVFLTLFQKGVGLIPSFGQSDLPGILRNPADGEIVQNG